MTTYQDLVTRVLRVLDDVDQAKFDDDIVFDGLLAAHDAILPWVPRFAKATITSGSDGLCLLPSDCYLVDAVQTAADGVFLPKDILSPNTVRGQFTTANNWSDYPRGYVSLSYISTTGISINVFYRAYWDKPSTSSDTAHIIEVPPHAHNGMVYYAGAHCLIPEAVSSANLNQFKMRPEQGTPVDNAIEGMSNLFLNRFYAEMKMMPPFVRGGGG